MKHTYKILEAKIKYSNVEKQDYIDVSMQVFLDEKLVGDVKKFGFDLGLSEDSIHAELDRVVDNMDIESESAIDNAKHEARQKAAKKTINSLLKEKNKDK